MNYFTTFKTNTIKLPLSKIISMKKIIIVIFILMSSIGAMAQSGETIFGLQYKPIVPNKFIGELNRTYDDLPDFHSTSTQKFGNSFGMIFRHYFLDNVALETGINFTKRKFDLHFEVENDFLMASADTSVSFINYQIPISALVFVKLSDELFMNASVGANLDFYPSTIGTSAVIDIDNKFIQRGFRTEWVQLGANANFGFEYRTRKKGAFYLGATYNQPFNNIMRFDMKWTHSGETTVVKEYIKGSYLTIDFRYYLQVDKD
jgi:hypothetical protein